MIAGSDQLHEHEEFKELCALSVAGNLTEDESAKLKAHLEVCEVCLAVYQEYLLVAKEGVPMLAARFDRREEAKDWDNSNVRSRVFGRIATEKAKRAVPHVEPRVIPLSDAKERARIALPPALKVGIAACLVVGVGLAGYRAGRIQQVPSKPIDASADARYVKLANEKQVVDNLLSADDLRMKHLEADSAEKQVELQRLRRELQANDQQINEITSAKSSSDQQIQSATQERDALNKKLTDTQQAFQNMQAELASVETERDEEKMRSASLRRQVDGLTAENTDQQHRIGNQDQYLSADRDIRELMGARQLYIADVFDVSSDSRTRKPYGRVFYTKGKSLIFYAFDLDRQPNAKDASTFQVWGRNESAQERPVKLGVLYVDNEANRRWALRCDDSGQLAEIDSVFVTVEPNAESNKPSGKPFLYASLRKEPNHP
jgi:hypothetical protein